MMETIITYGLIINNLKEASDYTETCINGSYIQIFYDRETGDLYTHFHTSENNWTRYDDAAVILVCNTSKHMSMQQIADAVRDEIDRLSAE